MTHEELLSNLGTIARSGSKVKEGRGIFRGGCALWVSGSAVSVGFPVAEPFLLLNGEPQLFGTSFA